MAKKQKTPATEPAAASQAPPRPVAPPTPTPPATYVNHTRVEWADGMVRLDLGDQRGDQPAEIRAAVAMTAQQARMLAGILTQAADALLPVAAAGQAAP